MTVTPLLVDSHCHLNFPQFSEGQTVGEVVARAEGAGVKVMQTICTKLHEFDTIKKIAEQFPGVYASVGVHPHEAEHHPDITAAQLIKLAKHPKVIGIGETGLDYYYEHSPRAQQQHSFKEHIKAARELDLPIIVHTREAEEDTIAILKEAMQEAPFKGLIHCFTSTRELAEASLEMGLSISISGIVTFKKTEELRAVVKDIPLEKILVETDAPFLAPVPYRGKTNEPAFTRHVAECVAELKGVTLEEVAKVTTDNFFRLFTKAKRP